MRSTLLRTSVALVIAASGFSATFVVANAASTTSTLWQDSSQAPAQQGPGDQAGPSNVSTARLMVCGTSAQSSPVGAAQQAGQQGQPGDQTGAGQFTGCLPLETSTTPFDAASVPTDSVVVGVVPAGETAWLRVDYPGGGRALGLTLQVPAQFAPELVGTPSENSRGNLPVDVAVNQRTEKDVTLGDPNADWPGLTRLGFLTQSNDTGRDRLFWMNSQGDSITYFVKVFNHRSQDVPIALGIEERETGGVNQATINPLSLDQYLTIAQAVSQFVPGSRPSGGQPSGGQPGGGQPGGQNNGNNGPDYGE